MSSYIVSEYRPSALPEIKFAGNSKYLVIHGHEDMQGVLKRIDTLSPWELVTHLKHIQNCIKTFNSFEEINSHLCVGVRYGTSEDEEISKAITFVLKEKLKQLVKRSLSAVTRELVDI